MVEHVKRLIRIIICQWKTVRILTNAETYQKLIGAAFLVTPHFKVRWVVTQALL